MTRANSDQSDSLREALEFYADPDNWLRLWSRERARDGDAPALDGGQRARDALASDQRHADGS